MIDAIVFSAVAAALLFVIAWALRPELRSWIEQPKHRFQEDLKRFAKADARRME